MKKFLLRITFFLTLFLFIASFSLAIYMRMNDITWKDFPGPKISDSYSFNEKMLFLKKSNIQADVISIGSSMTLNNINSVSVVKNLATESYINAGSWGMTMKDNFTLLKLLCSTHFPKIILVNSCLADFQQSDKKIDFDILNKYLLTDKEEFTFIPYLKKPSVEYYMKHLKYGKKLRSSSDDYEYLGFDKYGGVNFTNDHFNIQTARWIKNTIDNPIKTIQYVYLDSIAEFCKRNTVILLFFQSPVRQGIFSKFNKEENEKFLSHIKKEDSIISGHNEFFVNSTDTSWPDSLFVDGTHLNGYGSKIFTDYCFAKINNVEKIRDVLKSLSHK